VKAEHQQSQRVSLPQPKATVLEKGAAKAEKKAK
jgi:hypothetical protein